MPILYGPLYVGGDVRYGPIFVSEATGPVVVGVAAGEASAVVSYTGTADEYRLDGGTPAALGASPATISGLSANTEYVLEIRNDGGDWSTPFDFGTENPGSGGGDIPTGETGSATLAGSYAVRSAGNVTLPASYAVRAAGSATLAGSYAVRSGGSATLAGQFGVESPAGTGSATLAGSYAVRAGGSATLAGSYAVRTSGSRSLAGSYAVRAGGSATLAGSYAVRSGGSATLAGQYGVTGASSGGGSLDDIVEGDLTQGDVLRLLLAAMTGRTVDANTGVEKFLSADGGKARITVTYDAQNNRTTVVLDGSP